MTHFGTRFEYSSLVTSNDVRDVIFEEKSDIWMRIVRYYNGTVGIQVCPLKQIINGSPVWQIYNDSAPATKAIAYFVTKLNIDYLFRFEEMAKEIGNLTKENASLKWDNDKKDRENTKLKQELLEAHSSLDALRSDLLRKDPTHELPSTRHPYR
jgi:hypothetical protein